MPRGRRPAPRSAGGDPGRGMAARRTGSPGHPDTGGPPEPARRSRLSGVSTAPSGPSRPAWLLPTLLLVAAVLALGLRFGACSQDDAFISFRYAANLLEGQGLVFNPGERVEGYTNLSWTLLMAGLMALGVDPVLGSAALGLLCFSAVLPLTAALTQRAAAPGGALIAVAAAALVALDPWAVLESVEGLETALYTLLLTAAAWRILCENEVQDSIPTAHLGSGLLLSAAALTRPEAPMIAGLLHLGLLAGAPNRGLQLRRSLWAALPVLLTLGALTAWRLSYYGDPLPNTFYAKTGGAPLARGLVYLGAHARFHPALWLLLVLRPAVLRLDRRAPPWPSACWAPWPMLLAVGGDFASHRALSDRRCCADDGRPRRSPPCWRWRGRRDGWRPRRWPGCCWWPGPCRPGPRPTSGPGSATPTWRPGAQWASSSSRTCPPTRASPSIRPERCPSTRACPPSTCGG